MRKNKLNIGTIKFDNQCIVKLNQIKSENFIYLKTFKEILRYFHHSRKEIYQIALNV